MLVVDGFSRASARAIFTLDLLGNLAGLRRFLGRFLQRGRGSTIDKIVLSLSSAAGGGCFCVKVHTSEHRSDL